MSKFDFEDWLEKKLNENKIVSLQKAEIFEQGARAYRQESDKVIREIIAQERTRGYPTGSEWAQIVKKAKEHLGDE